MTPQWQAEYTVPPDLARNLIERQFPQLAPLNLTLLAEGWDNTVYRVNRELVFRFPRRQIAVPLIETERHLLPFVGPLLPLRIPQPRFHGSPTDEYPWPFLGYSLLRGRTVPRANLAEPARLALAEPLGRFLRALHQIPAATAAERGAGPDPISRLQQAESRLPALRSELREINRSELRPLLPALQAVVDAWPIGYVPRTDTLVHGDLHAEQVLVEAGEPSGIIDWGDAHLGDPALDIAGAMALLSPVGFRVFEAAYGEIDPITRRVARVRAVRHTLHGLHYAEASGDGPLLAEMVRALHHLAAGA